MRFEHRTAYVMGFGLPVAEALRRGTRILPLSSYLDDFIIGVFLLAAARAVSQGRTSGNPLLVAAWSALCGSLYYSFFAQIEQGSNADVSGLPNALVIGIKGVIYAVALTALVRALRNATASPVRAPKGN